MLGGRISYEEHKKTIEEAKVARQELAEIKQERDDLKTLNKQMLAEMQVELSDSVVPVQYAKFINGFGKFMVPAEDTLTNHYRLIYDRSNELDFWPDQSPSFDGIVAQTFLDPAFSAPNHPQYFDYEPLRDNIATVRNYLLQAVLNGVDPNDKKQLETAQRKLEQMGREIGVALQRDSRFRRPGSDYLDVRRASIPGSGAAEIYALLVSKQEQNKSMHWLKSLFKFDYKDWNLLPVEQSPFSKGHVDTFCLGEFSRPDNPSHLSALEALEATKASKAALQEADAILAQQEEEMRAAGLEPVAPEDVMPAVENAGGINPQQLSILGAAIAGSAFSLERVKRLPTPVKQRSVEIARDILDKLRIDLGSADNTQWLTFNTEETIVQGEAISSLAALYGESYQAALSVDPLLKNDPDIQAANLAVGKLAYLMKLQSAYKLLDEGREADAQTVLADTALYPEAWRQVEGMQIADLLGQMQQGLERTHAITEQVLQQQAQLRTELAQQYPSGGARQRPGQMTAPINMPPAAVEPAVQAPTAMPLAPPAADNLQQILQNNGMSHRIQNIRDMQSQAATMPLKLPPQIKQLSNQERPATSIPSSPQQGGFRRAVQQGQQRDSSQEFSKR